MHVHIDRSGILFLVNLVIPIRVAGVEEEAGLDLAQHGEIAYGV